MKLLSGDAPLPPDYRGGVIALGNFDGFHRGHQAVVGRAIDLARLQGAPAIVATFDPHPKRFFTPDAAPFLLSTIPQRLGWFGEAGAQATMVLGFDAAFAAQGPEDFVRLLSDRFGAAAVVTGADFTFGRGKSGRPGMLAALGTAMGVRVEAVDAIEEAGRSISSTRIREALQSGDCTGAARLLGRPFTVRGAVVHGDKLGRTIGYPTANLALGEYLRPRYGVYAVRGRLSDGRIVEGAANLGIRPQFDPPRELLEPYFFDFDEDLYGKVIEVELIHFLRPEARFGSLDELTTQIARDCDQARALLSA